MITIDNVAAQRNSTTLNFDKMTERFVTLSNGMVIPSPSIWTLEQNYYFLLRHSVQKLFNKKYVMKPSYLSHDEYGTVILAPVLMYMNNVNSIEDFNMDQVTIPDLEAIVYITTGIFPDKKIKDLRVINW